MTDISRRGFLGGVAAAAAVAALPMPMPMPAPIGTELAEVMFRAAPFQNPMLAQLEWARCVMDEMAGITFESLGASGGLDGH